VRRGKPEKLFAPDSRHRGGAAGPPPAWLATASFNLNLVWLDRMARDSRRAEADATAHHGGTLAHRPRHGEQKCPDRARRRGPSAVSPNADDTERTPNRSISAARTAEAGSHGCTFQPVVIRHRRYHCGVAGETDCGREFCSAASEHKPSTRRRRGSGQEGRMRSRRASVPEHHASTRSFSTFRLPMMKSCRSGEFLPM
jgi:hypothetical protein